MKLPRPSSATPLLLLLALGTEGEPCWAEPPARALLLLPSCPLEGLSEQELRSALALELQADGLTLARPGDGFGRSDVLLEVESTCQPHAALTLRVLFQDTERARTLSLAELPPGTRSRLLALSLAELVDLLEPAAVAAEPAPEPSRATGTEEPAQPGEEVAARDATAPSPPSPSPPSTSPSPPSSSPSPPPADTLRRGTSPDLRTALELAPELRWFSSGDALFGGRLGFDTSRVIAGGGLLLARASTEIGSVRTFLLHGFVGYRLLRRELASEWSGGLGPRLGVGWIEATGSPLDRDVNGTSAGAPYFDASAFGDLRFLASPYFRASLAIEGGVSRGLTLFADGKDAASYDGVFIAGSLGLMLSP